jgi:hypothetical protein
MRERRSINRRTFFRSAALSAAGLALAPRLASIATASPSAGEKLNIAAVGVGGMGLVNLRNMESENIVALLGNVAKRMQKKMDWDGEKMRFPNDEEANSYLKQS